MIRRMLFPLALAVALVAAPVRGHAQEKPKPEAAKPETPKAETAKEGAAEHPSRQSVTLRVQLVITRFQGDKKLASFPYTFVVTTGDSRARMRMGIDTPVPVTSTADSGKQTTSIQYRNVGTNIDCMARDMGEGRYRLTLGVENSSTLGNVVEGQAPLFRRFDTNLDPVLRDGQSIQTIASTDPVTGEVVKIEVTLNVIR